jgi:very-short-patch-repair endonuclease
VLAGTSHHAGLITYREALQRGISPQAIRRHLERGRWRRIHRGIYATFIGPLRRMAVLWAALLAAGPGAVLSHETAAEVIGLSDSASDRLHVTIPADRRVVRPSGVRVHLSRRLEVARDPGSSLPRTRVDDTVLDLAAAAATLDAAIEWMAVACERRRTTAARLTAAMRLRARVRWRRELEEALDDIAGGCRSLLEIRYLRDVERAHGLPAGKRQARQVRLGGNIYDDVNYVEYGTVVELDGRLAHPASASHRDLCRDNVAAVRGDVVLHFGWSDVSNVPCRVAKQVEALLADRGWTGVATRCRRNDCMIAKP